MTVTPFPQPEPYFESCPICHRYDVCLNDWKEHWLVCHRHKTKWRIGDNLFSSWKHETEADWARNRVVLSTYRLVEPSIPTSVRGKAGSKSCFPWGLVSRPVTREFN